MCREVPAPRAPQGPRRLTHLATSAHLRCVCGAGTEALGRGTCRPLRPQRPHLLRLRAAGCSGAGEPGLSPTRVETRGAAALRSPSCRKRLLNHKGCGMGELLQPLPARANLFPRGAAGWRRAGCMSARPTPRLSVPASPAGCSPDLWGGVTFTGQLPGRGSAKTALPSPWGREHGHGAWGPSQQNLGTRGCH